MIFFDYITRETEWICSIDNMHVGHDLLVLDWDIKIGIVHVVNDMKGTLHECKPFFSS